MTEIIGYADRLSVAPGETVAIKVSTDTAEYEATIVRLIHGDSNGPGFKEEVVAAAGRHPGRGQMAYPGSYAVIESNPAFSVASFAVQMWICPTTPEKGAVQGLLAKWKGEDGFALAITDNCQLALVLGSGRLASGALLRARQWYMVAASFDAASSTASLYQTPLSPWRRDDPVVAVQQTLAVGRIAADAPLTIAALQLEKMADDRRAPRGCYNGKIERPALFGRALAAAEVDRLAQGASPGEIGGADLIAVWDFSVGISSSAVRDTGPNRLDGALVNAPMRAVTGHGWRGGNFDFRHAREEYGAIHFHDDDLDDADWATDFTFKVPANARSGFYAARLRSGEADDHVPFFVRPRRGKPIARVAVLAPTFTYLAYANERLKALPAHAAVYTKRPMVKDPIDHVLEAHPELGASLYDRHSDGSGVAYSSALRPITNMRPKYRQWQVAGPRHLAADLYLIDWLEAKGIAYELVTDHDLDADGATLLEGCRVLLTGTHPEYWSGPMLDALEAFLTAGGRHMYLGGNGYYWVTAADPERPHLIEVRRGIAGSRAWTSEPGELHLSSTGELGGLWRYRGKGPHRIAGIGFCGMGYDAPTPGYRRLPGSFDPRAAFIFEGIGADEVIGDFGLVLGGAAGDEIDGLDFSLGSPPHALRLATATGYDPDHVMPVVEDFPELSAVTVNEMKKTVRADLAYFETANGGAVFAAGAITWCSSLSHNHYDNNVSRITENVLRHFMA